MTTTFIITKTMSLKPRRGPRQMSTATKPHGTRRKRNPDDTEEQMEEIREDAKQFMEENRELMGKLNDDVLIYAECPYMVAEYGDDTKCYCSARTREHCRNDI